MVRFGLLELGANSLRKRNKSTSPLIARSGESEVSRLKHEYNQESVCQERKRNTPRIASVAPDVKVREKFIAKHCSRQEKIERLWRNFFSDPSQWWDNTPEKDNPKFPDFKHKHTEEGLWLVDRRNPPWVASKLLSIVPGTLQTSGFSWTRKLSRCNKAGQYEMTLNLFQQMQQEGINADRFVFVPVLNACAGLQALKEGRHIHSQVVRTGCESDLHVSCCLIDMYAKCGSIDDAWRVFNKMFTRDVVAWNSMISGLANSGKGLDALKLFQQMHREGVQPDSVTFIGLLNACASIVSLEKGRFLHEQITQCGLESDSRVNNSLINMYAKCGSLEDAVKVFNKMHTRDVISFTSMIMGHVSCGQGQQALELFQQMKAESVQPDSITFVGLLNACGSIAALEEGRRIHEEISRIGREFDATLGRCLVDMYAKCGSLHDAFSVFNKMPTRDVLTWNAMILGYVNCRQRLHALQLLQHMQQEGVQPDVVTFLGLLKACSGVAALKEGRLIHEKIKESGFESDVHVSSTLVSMYAKCGRLEDAWMVFNKMPTRDVVACNAMILGHVNCGQGLKALELFHNMDFEPNHITFLGLLKACSSIAALEQGKFIHKLIRESGCESFVHVGSSLIDMYAKCGSIKDALKVFNNMSTRDVVSCTAMLGAYAFHGCANEAMSLFEQMSMEGIEINEITFVCLLSACSHAGLVKEGMEYFESMRSIYGVCPSMAHYSCMVDLLGRVGRLDDALEMITRMPCKPDISVWLSLLGSCRVYGNVEIGEHAAQQVLDLDPKHPAGYVLLSNIYAAAADRDKCEIVQQQR